VRCVPLIIDGQHLGRVAASGPLTQIDIDAIREFRRLLQEKHRMTEQQPTEAAPPPAPVDIDDLAPWVDADRKFSAEIDVQELKVAELKEARDQVRAKIQERIGDAHEARINGRPVIRWKPNKAGTYLDQKGLKADHPDLVAQYQKTKAPSRPYVIIPDGA
jgi:hypothetical protein